MRKKKSSRRARSSRPRRSAEETRKEILDAAEQRLVEGGPDALRLKQLADDVGVSHPAVLHHFGSREGLLEEVVKGAFGRLEADVIQALSELPEGGAPTALDVIERARDVLVRRGHGRAVAWLLLSGHVGHVQDGRVRAISEVAHQRRVALGGEGSCTFEDTLFRTLLIGLVLMGESVAGASLRRSAGLEGDAGAEHRFYEWLSGLTTTPVS